MRRVLIVLALLLASAAPPAHAGGWWPLGEGFAFSPNGHFVTSGGGKLRVVGPDGVAGPVEGEAQRGTIGDFVAVGAGGDVAALSGSEVRYRPANGRLGPVERIGTDGFSGEDFPAIAVDGSGTVIVAWTATDDGPLSVRIREPSGVWRPAQVLGRQRAFRPSLSVSPNGNAVVAWQMGDRIAVSSRAPGADFTPPRAYVGRVKNTGEPVAAVNDRGDAAAVWLQHYRRPRRFRGDNDMAFRIDGVLRSGGGDFGPARRLSPGDGGSPTVAALPSGQIVMAWLDGERVQARVRTPAGLVRRPRTLTTDGSDIAPPQALPIGRGVIAYAERDRGVSHLRLSHATELGGFAPPQPLMSAGGWEVGWAFAPSPGGIALVRRSVDELDRPPVVRRYALR